MRKPRYHIMQNRFSILFPLLIIISLGIAIIISSSFEKGWSHNWSGVSSSVKDSVLMAKNIGYTGGIGPNGRSLKKYAESRNWIMTNATESELLNLTKYPNGTIKAIGYEGLIRKNKFNEKVDIILKSIDDKEFKVFYSMGCQGYELEISEYLMRFVLMDENELPPNEQELDIDFGLSQSDKTKIMTAYIERHK